MVVDNVPAHSVQEVEATDNPSWKVSMFSLMVPIIVEIYCALRQLALRLHQDTCYDMKYGFIVRNNFVILHTYGDVPTARLIYLLGMRVIRSRWLADRWGSPAEVRQFVHEDRTRGLGDPSKDSNEQASCALQNR